MEAKAKAQVKIVETENSQFIEELKRKARADDLARKREEQRQKNIDSIAQKAMNALPENVSETPVDQDWVAQFFSSCQDFSSEQMQLLWGKLLAGEVAKPGAFSLRTLAAVKVLSKTDADLFTRFCSMVWHIENQFIAIVPDVNSRSKVPVVDLRYSDFIHLDAIGLIRFDPGKGLKFSADDQRDHVSLRWYYQGNLHVLSNGKSKQVVVGPVLLTDIGRQLASISGSQASEEYRVWAVDMLRKQDWEVTEPQAEPNG